VPATITNSIGMQFVRIPAGTFLMGSPEGEKDRLGDEHQHEVEITQDFYLGKYEVTQEQYEKLMGTNPSNFSPVGEARAQVDGLDTRQFPVERVSWHDAVRFCEKLNKLRGERAAGRTYRLPSEAEWEYSCRGGARSYQAFNVGDSLSSDQANFNHFLERTTTTGSYKPNGFGLYDMHGNVREWCADWHDPNYYKSSPRKDPPGPTTGTLRILRGGAWVNGAGGCRSAVRYGNDPGNRYSNYGFRVVCVPGKTR
jgi:formylglycine-generating enzyme required for sulfatase activity